MMKYLYYLLIPFQVFLLSQPLNINALEETYLNVHDYGIYGDDDIDDTLKIQNLINQASDQKKSLYFPGGKYIISDNIYFRAHVSLKGDPNTSTIIYGDNPEYAVILRDSFNVDLSGIVIENFIFDNVVIFSNSPDHNRWHIRQNVFINGKKADLEIMTGLIPNSNNQNGGELTGYYISRNYEGIDIYDNLFLRDEQSKGRGISTYQNLDTYIYQNYFGQLEHFDKNEHLISPAVIKIKDNLMDYKIKNQITVHDDQGYFMTAINNLNYDENIHIYKNVINLNRHIEENNYNNGSGLTLGYNSDHLIYSKGFDGLFIFQNYFYGQQNNPDGGVKIRNGENIVVTKNYFDDVALLMYIQNDHAYKYFRNVWVSDNTFNVKSNNAKWGSGISVMFYVADDVSNITIQDNTFYSNQAKVDHIYLDLVGEVEGVTNLHIKNNTYNHLNDLVWLTYKRRKNHTDIYNKINIESQMPYEPLDKEKYIALQSTPFYPYEVPFKIIDDILYSDEAVFVNGVLYEGTKLKLGDQVEIYKAVDILITNEGIISPMTVLNKTVFNYQADEEFVLKKRMGEVVSLDDLNISQMIYYDETYIQIENHEIHLEKSGVTDLYYADDAGNLNIVKLEVYGYEDIHNLDFGDNLYRNISYELDFLDNLSNNQYTVALSDGLSIENNYLKAISLGLHTFTITDNINGDIAVYELDIKDELNLSITPQKDIYFVDDQISIVLDYPYDNTVHEITYSEHVTQVNPLNYKIINGGRISITVKNKESLDSFEKVIDAYEYITKVDIPQKEIKLKVGQSYLIKAPLITLAQYEVFDYYISDTTMIDMNDAGLITALKTGNVVITIKGQYSNLEGTILVKIEDSTSNDQSIIQMISIISGSIVGGGVMILIGFKLFSKKF